MNFDKIDENLWGSELYVLNIQTLLYHEMHTHALELCNKAIFEVKEVADKPSGNRSVPPCFAIAT